MRMRPAVVVASLLVVVCTAVASAHDTWLLADALSTPVGTSIAVKLTSGEIFPVDDFAIEPARVSRAIVRLGGTTAPLGAGQLRPKVLRYTWRPARAGIATMAVELLPRTLTLAPDKIAEYLDEIDATPALRATWARIPSPKQWRESYTKHAKTYVRAGDPGADSSFSTPLGLGLELVARSNPTTLRAGDTLTVRVFKNGVAMPGFHVGAMASGAARASFFVTDAMGDARVVFPSAGRWLLNGTELRRSSKPNLEWESDFTTLTVSVAAKGRRRGAGPD